MRTETWRIQEPEAEAREDCVSVSHDQSKLGRRVHFTLKLLSPSLRKAMAGTQGRSLETGTWRQELMQRPPRSAAYCLLIHFMPGNTMTGLLVPKVYISHATIEIALPVLTIPG